MLQSTAVLSKIIQFYRLRKSVVYFYNPSKHVCQILNHLREANIIRAVSKIEVENNLKNFNFKKQRKFVKIFLNIPERRIFLILNSIKFYSTCSRNYNISLKLLRKMVRIDNFKLRYIILVFTSYGLITAEQAVALNCGGILFCLIHF